MFMAHLKEILFIILDFLGLGSATIQIVVSITDAIEAQQGTIEMVGLSAQHESILFWVNIFKATTLFLLSAVYIAFRIYGYYKKHIKELDKKISEGEENLKLQEQLKKDFENDK